MGLFNKEYDFDKLVRLTSSGVEVSSFVEIKNALIKKYKEIYGNDIDVETVSADGQYLMMLSLMLYNGYNGLLYLNKNLDPSTATGKFLDVLCGFNNIFRNLGYHSYTYLYVKYIGTKTNYTSEIIEGSGIQTIQCIDKAGRTWTWTEGKGVDEYATKFNPNVSEVTSLMFVCDEPGRIETYADETVTSLNPNTISWDALNKNNHGDVSDVIDINTFPFEVWQASDAVAGEPDESDDTLRSRLLTERGNSGLTVQNGLLGSLLEINGVEDVRLYNNVVNQYDGLQANDGTIVAFHNQYLVLRYKENTKVDTSLIGNTINDKLTPGIVTTEFSGNSSLGISETVVLNSTVEGLAYTVYWKKCVPIYPSMQLKFKVNNTLYNKKESETNIINALKNYTFNLSIFDDLNIPNILSELNSSDKQINNQFTFMFYEGKLDQEINGSKIIDTSTTGQTYNNKDTYYSYNDFDYKYIETYITEETFVDDGSLYTYNETYDTYNQVESGSVYDSSATYYKLNQGSKIIEFTRISTGTLFDDWQLDIYTNS